MADLLTARPVAAVLLTLLLAGCNQRREPEVTQVDTSVSVPSSPTSPAPSPHVSPSQIPKSNPTMAAIFLHFDYGAEHGPNGRFGRVVVDVFSTHAVVAIASYGELKVATFSDMDRDTFDNLTRETLAVCQNYAAHPLRVPPGTTFMTVTLGHLDGAESVTVRYDDDMLEGNAKTLKESLLQLERRARKAIAENIGVSDPPKALPD